MLEYHVPLNYYAQEAVVVVFPHEQYIINALFIEYRTRVIGTRVNTANHPSDTLQ